MKCLEHGEREMEKCMRVDNLSLSLLLCVLLPVQMAAYVCERIKMKEEIGCKVTDTCH